MTELPEGIAIIGMAGRFPGAADLAELWRNLRAGVESISRWSREELEQAGVDPALLDDPRYVRASGAIPGVELFDAPFFGISSQEAEAMDPQHRLFLEHAWQALESAGYDAESYSGLIGIFGGMSMSNYLLNNLLTRPDILDGIGPLYSRILNDKDFLVALAAFKMGLTGPSITVQSACSTSLLATCLACQSLTSYQCDMALAGGVTVNIPQTAGYIALDSVSSPDGHCRAYDVRGRGTVQGSGVGVVVLKRLADALADGDTIRAVIKGSATNNDGSLKVGYTAPGVEGQIQVVAMAQAVAGIRGDTITYVEGHGTGTPLGDPIEVEALTEVFRSTTDRTGYCALGSVKTNIGHLDAAAGVASLIKTVLALENREIPPHPNFSAPNPQIDLAGSPFFVNTEALPWRTDGIPRRAAVSSFAIGGVNAHVVLEEASPTGPSDPAPPWHLLLFSARTETALERVRENLLGFLRERPEMAPEELADVAFTLQSGRRAFEHRRALVYRSREEAVEILEAGDARRLLAGSGEMREARIVFLFPGLGNQYPGMGLDLYRSEPRFRAVVDECCEILRPELGLDLRTVLYPSGIEGAAGSGAAGPDLRAMLGTGAAPTEAERRLARTELAQPAVFVVELALGRLLMDLGLRPDAMVGFSIGEYVAACLAGVLDLGDALRLVARRARLIGELPEGGMLAVPAGETEAARLGGSELSVAAVLGPELCVLAGPEGAVAALESRLTAEGKVCRRLQTTHAFHSRMMDPITGRFRDLFRGIALREPEIPYLSNVTGTWITKEQATSPDWWGRHLREAVRFSDGVAELWREPGRLLVEVGPGQTLGSWALQHPAAQEVAAPVAVPTLRHAWDRQDDFAFLQTALGRMWLAGVRLDGVMLATGRRRRVPLPTYPFERQRYWVDRGSTVRGSARAEAGPEAPLTKHPDPADWFYLPLWRQSLPLPPAPDELPAGRRRWLLCAADAEAAGLAARLAAGLEERGGEALLVRPGEDLDALFPDLGQRGWQPEGAVWLSGAAGPEADVERVAERSFFGLLALAQAIGWHVRHPLHLTVVTTPVHRITGAEVLSPGHATLFGPALVLPQELPEVSCRVLDVEASDDLPDLLLAELAASSEDRLAAYRGGQRWTRAFEPLRLGPAAAQATRLRSGGVYLITGGLGGVGLTLAEQLAASAQAKLVLVGRSVPERAEERLPALRRIVERGGEVVALAADVTDEAAMRRAVEAARARFGRIDGVIHAAGVPPGGLLQVKGRETAAAVLAPKVRGTLVLERVLRDDPPDFLLLCSSLTGVSGAFGLVDHCAANAFLDAFAQQRAGGKPRVLAVDWDTWLEVGQAAQAARQHGLDGGGGVPVRHPWLALRRSGEGLAAELSTSRDWVVDEHRIAGDGVLPGTASIELIRAAFAAQEGKEEVQIRRLVFLAPLRLRDSEAREVRVALTGDRATLESRASGEGSWERHAEAAVADAVPAAPPRADLEAIRARCARREAPAAAAAEGSARLLSFGPRWQGLLRELFLGADEGLARLELDARFLSDLDGGALHPALLDAATGCAQLLGDGVHLPLGYEEIAIRGPLPPRVYSHFRLRGEADGDTLTCDLSVMDEEGNERIGIRGYTLRRLQPEAWTAPPPSARPTAAAGAADDLRGVYGEGLRPSEGGEVLLRLLATALRAPQVLVSTRDLNGLLRRAETLSQSRVMEAAGALQERGAVRARPPLPTALVAPRNEVERTLADTVAHVLRVEPVGVHDNFFDLGGDSLAAARLVGAMGDAFDVQLSLSTVFEAPTVAELAVAVVRAQADLVGGDALAEALAEIQGLSPEELAALLEEEERAQREGAIQ